MADKTSEQTTNDAAHIAAVESSVLDEVVLDTSAPSLEPPRAVVPVGDAQPGKREGVAPEIWVVGLIAVIIILLLLFGIAL